MARRRRAARRRQGPRPVSSAEEAGTGAAGVTEAEGRRTARPVATCESCSEQGIDKVGR